jgi:hypothetical protein
MGNLKLASYCRAVTTCKTISENLQEGVNV